MRSSGQPETLDALDALQVELEREEQASAPPKSPGYQLPSDFLLSIVVPCYNEEATIRDVISTLYTLPIPVEVIAVDDGSSDLTCAKLTRLNHEYPELKVCVPASEPWQGSSPAKRILTGKR